jgi:hypothetical protein
MHYEALDVYKQHFSKILDITQIPNPIYATAIVTVFQVALQAAITYHGTMPHNPDPVPILVNLSPQQLIDATTNIPPNTDAPAFVDPVGELFRVFELEFQVKSSEKILQFANFSR